MNISLPPHYEAFVNHKLRQDKYVSASDVMLEALKLLEERDTLMKIKQDTLKREVGIGLAQLDRGESKPFDADAIKARGRERLKQMQQ